MYVQLLMHFGILDSMSKKGWNKNARIQVDVGVVGEPVEIHLKLLGTSFLTVVSMTSILMQAISRFFRPSAFRRVSPKSLDPLYAEWLGVARG